MVADVSFEMYEKRICDLKAALEEIANKMRSAYPGCPCKEIARKALGNEAVRGE